MQPPVSLSNAFALQQNGSASDYYELYFDKIPGEYFAQEIRLSAWVKGTTGSVFSNTLKYSA